VPPGGPRQSVQIPMQSTLRAACAVLATPGPGRRCASLAPLAAMCLSHGAIHRAGDGGGGGGGNVWDRGESAFPSDSAMAGLLVCMRQQHDKIMTKA